LLHDGMDFLAVAQRLGTPLMVKPANEGSSIGMSKVRRAADLEAAYRLAAKHDSVVIAEQFIAGPEFTAAILGRTPLPLIRLETPRDFYDYEAKYLDEGSKTVIPANLPAALVTEVQRLSIEAFRAIDAAGLARVDFLVRRDTSAIYLNEINTMPGFTTISMYSKMWEASGLSYTALVDRLITLAMERHGDKQRLRISAL
ncbi:MAG TPA: hypothetical protein VEA16_13170, partial [Vicinamibacterales bacterium]|nr:hypothetical protein [Vicinamibacterales bacterium]